MVTLKLTDEQVVEMIRQLPPEGKKAVLDALGSESELWWQATIAQGEDQLHRLCADRGLNWDAMSEAERESFIDDLLHEA